MVLLSTTWNKTPVRTGRESSALAAKTIFCSPFLSSPVLVFQVMPFLISGITGKSSAATPFITDWYLSAQICSLSSLVSSFITASGKLLTKSCIKRAGTVKAPSFSTLEPTVWVMAISRLVADRFKRFLLVLIKTLDSIGKVARLVATRATVFKALARFGWVTCNFIIIINPYIKLVVLVVNLLNGK